MTSLGINLNPSVRQLRQFAAAFLIFFLLAGTWAFRRWGVTPAAGFWTAAVVGGLVGFLRPPWIRPVYLGLSFVTWPIGWVVSMLLLALVYYGVFTPVGLLLRLFGHDPLTRRLDPGAKTYWTPRETAGALTRYFRQF